METVQQQSEVKTGNSHKNASNMPSKPDNVRKHVVMIRRSPLTTKKAVELLLSGKLKRSVCRFCLHTTYPLSELEQIMQIAGNGAVYKVTIRDIMASFYPFKVVDDPNYPSKICEKCLDKAIHAYLFSQHCEQSERALHNCFEDIYEKFDKLDPLEQHGKRGRPKLRQNHNVIRTQHHRVVDYAEPIWNLVNVSSVSLTDQPEITPLECKKCWQVLPNIESLVNHEKSHPKSMWFHCRVCGKSYVRKFQMTRHIKSHAKGKIQNLVGTSVTNKQTVFECKECSHVSENYDLHLQHIEKHKFQMVLQYLVDRKMDKLCSVCLDPKSKMVDMDKMISLHGGYPELTGDRTLYNILGSTVPEMHIHQNYTGTKICENCLEHAITSYIFINKIHYIRHRLDTCITKMLESIKDIQPEHKLFIEVAQNGVMPITETYDESLLFEDNEIDVAKLKVDVLEDEYRLKSDEESSSEEVKDEKPDHKDLILTKKLSNNNINKIKVESRLTNKINGYKYNSNNLGEFLTFNKKDPKSKKTKIKLTCPLCNKHFVSDFFLKNHLLKHVNKKVNCDTCCKTFKSKFYLHEHRKMSHILKTKSFSVCRICGRTFKSESKRLHHEKCHTSIFCQFCSKTFKTQTLFNCHLQRHVYKLTNCRKKQPQNCSLCEKGYANDNDLSVHINKVHLQIRPFNCDMCERKFYTELHLKHHKKVHTIVSKERCEFCSKVLKCRKHLVTHIRKHLGVKPFKCVLCSDSFYSEFRVRQHMKKWHGCSYCCKLCRTMFATKKGLETHVNTAHFPF